MQAQTEPKLHPETANMEFEQVITKRSATLKVDLKVNLEPKWFLRRFPWKFHVSDFRVTILFTSYCAHILTTIQVPGLWWGKNYYVPGSILHLSTTTKSTMVPNSPCQPPWLTWNFWMSTLWQLVGFYVSMPCSQELCKNVQIHQQQHGTIWHLPGT